MLSSRFVRFPALALVMLGLAGSAWAAAANAPVKPIRIAVMTFSHETVTFLKFDTTIDDFTYEGSPARGEALLKSDPTGYIGGFTQVAHEFPAVELVGIESPLGSKSGSGSGWLTEETYEHFVGKMIADLKAQGPFDGVYMALHGAMGARGVIDPEAELARRVREVVGPKAFLAGTFDPHGNEGEAWFKSADLAFTIKYYPHYDAHLQGERAARMLIRSIRGDYKPTHAVAKLPFLTPTVLQWTGKEPWSTLVQRALTWEAREPDVYVNFFYGFPFSDVTDLGMCFEVITNGKPELAKKIADDMGSTAWRLKDQLYNSTQIWLTDAAVTQAKKDLAAGKVPVVLADYSDRTGAATWILDQTIKQDLSDTLFVTIADKKAVDAMRKKGVRPGDPFDMMVGAGLDEADGKPVHVVGTVNTVSNGIGRRANSAAAGELWVSIKFGKGNVLVLSPHLVQVTDPEPIRDLGIEPDSFKVIVLKSRVHFRRGFDDNGYAKDILITEPPGGGLGTVHLDQLPYKNAVMNDFYPFNKNVKYP